MAYFEKCPKDVLHMVRRVMEEWHPELVSSDVTVDCLFQYPRTVDGVGVPNSGLKHGGYSAAAVTRIVNVKDRVKGCADVEIIFDVDTWKTLSASEREALIDHELQHSMVVIDDAGQVKEDEAGRPMLKIRKHDRQFGWFDVIAQRRGRTSFEVKQAIDLVGEAGQLYLPGLRFEENVVDLRTPRIGAEV